MGEQTKQERKEFILKNATEYEIINEKEKLLKARRETILKPMIKEGVELLGDEDEKGNRHVYGDDITVTLEKRDRSEFNDIAAQEILENKNLLDRCGSVRTEIVLDEEKIMEAFEAGLLSSEDINRMFNENVGWALKVKLLSNDEYDMIKELRKKTQKGEIEGFEIEQE